MSIAVLYICTGNYSIFWEQFFTSSETFFVPDAVKEYFVFTDAADLPYKDHARVHVHHQQKKGWPYDTLMRFHTFSQVKEQLKNFDHIFFFNANTTFVQPVSASDILPGPQDDGLTVVQHPGYYRLPVKKFPYENIQRASTAYMRRGEGKYYFQGCLNGGTADAYLQMIGQLTANVQADLDKGIIALWHDESHLNKYMADKHPKILTPAFAFPEGWDLPFTAVISMLDKSRFGGHTFMRGASAEPKKTFVYRLRRFINKRVQWLQRR